jgi:hypothetical protein
MYPEFNEAKKKALREGAEDFKISTRKNKRFMVKYNGKWIYFADPNMENFLIHRDNIRKENFHNRFKNSKNYNNKTSGLYWSQKVLWS